MTAALRVRSDDQVGPPRLIGRELVVGRSTECDLQLADAAVSRRHFRVVQREDGFVLEDLGSRSGTLVNGALCTTERLHHGDQLQAGATRLVFVNLSRSPTVDTDVELVAIPHAAAIDASSSGGDVCNRTDIGGLIQSQPASAADALGQLERMRGALQLTRRLAHQQTEPDVLRCLEEAVPELVPLHRMTLFLNDRAGELEPCVVWSAPDRTASLMRIERQLVEACRAQGVPLEAPGDPGEQVYPIAGAETVLGVLYVEQAEPGQQDVAQLLSGLAHDAGLALERIRRTVESAAQRQGLRDLADRLTESERRHRRLFEHSVVGIYRADADGRPSLANPALLEMLGLGSLAELQRRVDAGYTPRVDDGGWFADGLRRAGVVRSWEADWRRADGSLARLRENAIAVRDAEGRVVGHESTLEDVTALRETDELLGVLIDSLPVAVVGMSAEQRVTLWNPWAERMFGWSAAEVCGHALPRAEGEPPGELEALVTRTLAGDPVVGHETRRRRRDGEPIDVAVWGGRVDAPGRAETACVIAIADVSARTRAEAMVRETAARYELLYQRSPVPMFVYDRTTLSFKHANDAAIAMYGYTHDEFLRMTIKDIRPAEDVGVLQRVLPTVGAGFHVSEPVRHRRKDGSVLWVEVIGNQLGGGELEERLVLIRDLTQQREAEAASAAHQNEMRQLQKMEAMGQLAGGVAHDFNNMLTAILGFAHLARQQSSGQVSADLGEIIGAAERAEQLTRQLLVFSRNQVQQSIEVELDALVREMRGMLDRLVGDDIDVELAPAAGRAAVLGDPGQLQQVLLNLVVNARDALPDGGRIRVWTSAVDGVDGGPGWVTLVVSDTGPGVPVEIRDRIFEPFFTTKPSDRGTGLGLSTVYGIVQQHGGRIELDPPSPGHGARFRIRLPRHAGDPGRQTASERLEVVAGTETILVIDDQPTVRRMVCDALQAAGYSVLAAGTPEEAHEAVARAGDAIQLLITDVVLPRLSGPDLVDQLQATLGGIPVLFMSGHIGDDRGREKVRDQPFLQKPFAPGSLWRVVRDLLDAASA